MKKTIQITLISLLILSLLTATATAGITDWLKSKFTGEPQLAPGDFEASLQLSNTPPHIVSWIAPDADTVTPLIQPFIPTCNGITTVETSIPSNEQGIRVTISDNNGDGDLDTSATVSVTVSNSVSGASHPGTCTLDPTTIGDDNNADFDCSFNMQYYDIEDTDWIITVTATDDTGGVADNNNIISNGGVNYPYFYYGLYSCFEIKDNGDPWDGEDDKIEWTGISTSITDKESNEYMEIYNQGNMPINTGDYAGISYIQIKADNLEGVTPENLDEIEETSFSVATESSGLGSDPEGPCNTVTYSDAQIFTDSLVKIDNAVLPISPDGSDALENLYFCFELMVLPQAGLTNDDYRSKGAPENWQIELCSATC